MAQYNSIEDQLETRKSSTSLKRLVAGGVCVSFLLGALAATAVTTYRGAGATNLEGVSCEALKMFDPDLKGCGEPLRIPVNKNPPNKCEYDPDWYAVSHGGGDVSLGGGESVKATFPSKVVIFGGLCGVAG